ncbi:MAG: AraC family transcriptional regulator N-terminal domain-containing protein [Syntrophaceae bacterium]
MTEGDRAGLARTNNLLKEKLLRWMPGSGDYPTAIEGLTIFRRDKSNQLENCFYKPLVAVIVQGFKRSVIGSEEYRYGENYCLVTGGGHAERKLRHCRIPGEAVFGTVH